MSNGDGPTPGGTLGDSAFLTWLRTEVRDKARAALMQGASPQAVDEAIRAQTKTRGGGVSYQNLADVERRVTLMERAEGGSRQEQSRRGTQAALDRYSRNVRQGATLWHLPQIADAVPGGDTGAQVRGQLAQDLQEHPIMSRVEQGFGALAPALVGAGAGSLLAGAGGPFAMGNMLLGGGIAGTEALIGGEGMSEQPTLGGRLREAAPGAAVAAAAGLAAAPAAIAASNAPLIGRVTRMFRSPEAARNIMARAIPAEEASAVGTELTAMQRVNPAARVMDTRAGQRVVGHIAGDNPEAAKTLTEALQARATQAEGAAATANTSLEQLLSGGIKVKRARYAREFWESGDVGEVQGWLGTVPPEAAQAWKDAAVSELAQQMAAAPDKVAFLMRPGLTDRLRLVLPAEEFEVLDRGLQVAQRLRDTEHLVERGVARGQASRVAEERAGLGLGTPERRGPFEGMIPDEGVSRGTRKAVGQMADYLAQANATRPSPLQPRLFGRNMRLGGRPIDPRFAGILAGAAGSESPLAYDLFHNRER